ncbi:MAG: hypothetical protein OXU20_35035 [Myxococcales bacterium]|nr:hypothetical protein [Myxococcales bacterium]
MIGEVDPIGPGYRLWLLSLVLGCEAIPVVEGASDAGVTMIANGQVTASTGATPPPTDSLRGPFAQADTASSGMEATPAASDGGLVAGTGNRQQMLLPCPVGSHRCEGACVRDDSVDTCGQACMPCTPPLHASATCDGQTCGFECRPGRRRCDDHCIYEDACCTEQDCPESQVCNSGRCGCPTDFRLCGLVCIPHDGCCNASQCREGIACVDNRCMTWCAAQGAPSGVAETDFVCTDFDNSFPPPTWEDYTTGDGTIDAEFEGPASGPVAVRVSVGGGDSQGASTDQAKFRLQRDDEADWPPIASLSLAFQLKPGDPASFESDYAQFDLLVLDAREAYVFFGFSSLDGGDSRFFHVSAGEGECRVTEPIPYETWSQLVLTLHNDRREVSLLVNGRSALGPTCYIAPPPAWPEERWSLTFGLRNAGSILMGSWSVAYDNLTIAVKR